MASPSLAPSNFIRDIILEDLKTNKHDGRVQTRFPPEPNGHLHIGHAKAICIDFGLADEFGGHTNLRFDDTNPAKEETEYVESIKADVNWLGFKWDGLFYASDYFDQLCEWAIKLIKDGKAYVDDLTADEIRKYRGTLTEPGRDSPYRSRSAEENLNLFERMRAGEFPDGSRTLRAKIDMASPNLNLRDPVMYRILHAEHHRTGNKWCIYPMYDYAHGESDSIERVTHSLCTLEFEDHRPLYNWFIQQLGIFPSRQIEFDRLNLTYTLLSKRKLLQLVQEGRVCGWDDPRMPTLGGLRRRGYTPEAIRNFVASIGVSKTTGSIELAMLEHFVREDLNKRAPRVMAVLHPLKVVIDNYPENELETWTQSTIRKTRALDHGKYHSPASSTSNETISGKIRRRRYFRLSPGREVRLRYGYFITAKRVVKNDKGNVIEVHCTYDPETKGGNAPNRARAKAVRVYKFTTKVDMTIIEQGQTLDTAKPVTLDLKDRQGIEAGFFSAGMNAGQIDYALRKLDEIPENTAFLIPLEVKSTIHWVSAARAVDAEVRIYENLFSKENPSEVEEGQDFTANLNPQSLELIPDAKLEPSLAGATVGQPISIRAAGIFLR